MKRIDHDFVLKIGFSIKASKISTVAVPRMSPTKNLMTRSIPTGAESKKVLTEKLTSNEL